MNYEDFKRELLEEIVARKPDFVEKYETTSVTKNNQHEKEGISICYAGYDNIRPTAYFDDQYDAYKAGVAVEEIAREITNIAIREYKNVQSFDLKNMDIEQAKEHLSLRLINREWNKDKMDCCAYQEIHDLIAVPYLEVDRMGQKASMLVNHDVQRQMFCMTDEELLSVARENMLKQNYTIVGMTEKMRETMGEEFDEIYPEECLPEKDYLYVMSNNDNWYGAVGMMSNQMMEKIQDKLEEEMFFMLPSSTHEMLIVRASVGNDPAELQEMVKMVNEEQVSPEERLGENIYFYNGQKLQICNTQQEAMKQIAEKWKQKEVQEQTQTHGRRIG